MIGAILKAAAQCFSKPFLGTLVKAFIVTVVLLAGLSWLVIWLAHFSPSMPWLWLNEVLSILVTVGAVLAALLLVGPVAMIVIGLFLDEIAREVDKRYYPETGPPRHVPLGENLRSALGLAALAALLNVLALPLYIFLPGLNLVLYFVLNGSLIGREYYLLVAARRLDFEGQRSLRRRHGISIFLAGCLIAVLLLVPGVNFVSPLFGTALFVHLVEIWRKALPQGTELPAGTRAAFNSRPRGLRKR
ncbi:MAG: EI24 domain-containing protein [Alphaproteobacteria bacterium]